MRQEARLPLDKLTKCHTLLHHFHKKRSVTVRELQSLNFCCSVVIPGRDFLRRLIDLTSGLTSPYHHIRLNRESKHDICMWLTFLDNFNGRAFFLSDRWETSSTLKYIQMPRHLKVMVRYLESIGLAAPFRMHGTVSTLLSSSFSHCFGCPHTRV